MSAHALEMQLAREFCSKAVPCEGCNAAARLVLANPAAVLRLLERIAPHPHNHPHLPHLPHPGREAS